MEKLKVTIGGVTRTVSIEDISNLLQTRWICEVWDGEQKHTAERSGSNAYDVLRAWAGEYGRYLEHGHSNATTARGQGQGMSFRVTKKG